MTPTDWFSEKTELNFWINKLCHVRDQMPSVHNDSIPAWDHVVVAEARSHIASAIRLLEPLRRYKRKGFTPEDES